VVLYGPSVEDFADAQQLLESAGAGMMVRNADELAERCLHLLDHPQELADRGRAGQTAVMANQGATRRNAEMALKLLENE
jgi:3-deoxy-D-manno-octulosonic-acid transferase